MPANQEATDGMKLEGNQQNEEKGKHRQWE
jgi:hypothetical protein